MAAPSCPTCDYRYSLMERCGPTEPAPDCTGLNWTHWHRHCHCVRCLAAWMVLSEVGAPDPDPTLH